MKRNNYFILTAIGIVLTASIFGCQDAITVTTSVTLNKESLTLYVGDSETLSATVYPETPTSSFVIWSSSDNEVASVTVMGVILAKTAGTTTITASSLDGNSSASCQITVLSTDFRNWGLGTNLTSAHSNNVNYEWYIDQVNTGPHSYINCGPASATMAIKWSNPNFTKTTEDARNTYLPDGGWWYTSDIMNYLTANNTAFSAYTFNYVSSLVSMLNNGNIAILCLDMYYVQYRSTPVWWRIDKFYVTESPEWGHFIVVKGYKIVDDTIWFEVYDPWSLNVTYSDGSLKGRDRYYRSEDIMQATGIWWPYMIIIHNADAPNTKASLDSSTIVHQWGR